MSGLYTQPNSPYYWLRYYDKFEEDTRKRRKSLNTKITVTEADKKRVLEARVKGAKVKLVGTPAVKRIKREFEQGLAEWALVKNSGVLLKKEMKLSDGFEEFKKAKSTPGRKGTLKKSTISNYAIAVEHMLACCKDKYIYQYKEHDYVQLLFRFEEKSLSINSRSIYTRALHAVWKFFVDKFFTKQNIIEVVEPEEKEPRPIAIIDLYIIIDYIKDGNEIGFPKPHYWIVYFMLLTGCRPSSAIVQLKEDIDFKRKHITINNVKTGARKGKKFYRFPLYAELERFLVEEMGIKQGDKGRLFEHFSVIPEHYTWPLSFWKRAINHLHTKGTITEKYTLKQIRPTFASFLINVYAMDIYDVQKLLDHADIKITDKHYVNYNTQRVRRKMEAITYDSFLNGEFE